MNLFTFIVFAILISASLFALYRIRRVYRYHFGIPNLHPFHRADLSDLTGNTLSHYYVHMDGKYVRAVESGLYSTPPFDENGIPMVDYKREINKQYNPYSISQFALENWELFLQTGNQKHLDTFLKQANWLVENQEEGKWYNHFEVKRRGLKNPWVSCIAQGAGISVLLRAWQIKEDEGYLRAAEKAFGIFKIPIDRGGISYKNGTGTWFEEYPNPSAPSHVMNGHIWALFGIWDMYRVTHDADALRLFKEGVLALKTDISKYDTGFWVLYDQQFRAFLSSLYINSEINQLKVMHALTEDSIFSDYAKKWEQYRQDKKRSFYRVLKTKVYKKLK